MVKPTLRSVRVPLLDPHPENPRIGFREDVVESIRQQIAEEGGFNPAHAIIVRAQGERFQVVCGHQRVEAAKRAGLAEIPTWLQEMDDDEAFMQLVLGNLQGELSPLELGLHALAARGRQGARGQGIAEYARRVGRGEDAVTTSAHAAEVWKETAKETVPGRFLSPRDSLSLKVLRTIHAAPRITWPRFVAVATDQGWTVETTQQAVANLKAALAARPGWMPEPDAGALVGDATLADALARAYEAATDADAALPEVAHTWDYQDSGECKAVDGRTYRVMRPVANEAVQVRAAFRAAVLALPDLTATGVRQAQKDAYRGPGGRVATVDAPAERLEEEGWKYPSMAKWSASSRMQGESALDQVVAADATTIIEIATEPLARGSIAMPEAKAVQIVVNLVEMGVRRRGAVLQLWRSGDYYFRESARRVASGEPPRLDPIHDHIMGAINEVNAIGKIIDASHPVLVDARKALAMLKTLERKVVIPDDA